VNGRTAARGVGIIALVVLLSSVVLFSAVSVSAQQERSGCCCNLSNGRAQVDSYLPRSGCLSGFADFVEPTVDDVVANRSCGVICGARSLLPPPVAVECADPNARIPVRFLTLLPVQGRRAFNLYWTAPCPAAAFIVARCQGAGCTPVDQVAVTGSTFFIDEDAGLRVGEQYTYAVTARYTVQGDADPVLASGDLGDIECLGQPDDSIFCVGQEYYARYRDYLVTFGYGRTDAKTFKSSFDDAVRSVFFAEFNKAYRCNVDLVNQKVSVTVCSAGTTCVAGTDRAECVVPSQCEQAGVGFGFGVPVAQCEGAFGVRKYCFFDRSGTAADSCYACNPAMSCIDYRSRGACQRDNCGAGLCEWRDVFPKLGIGVCADTRIDNCPLCDDKGSVGAPNVEAYNEVFDRCVPERAAALGMVDKPCFWRDDSTATGCDGVSCVDYKRVTDCVGPGVSATREVRRDGDNRLIEGSFDPCRLQVCQWDDTIQCHKNQNGRVEPDTRTWPDCAFGDVACERDVLAPESTLLPTLVGGKVRFVNVVIRDKRNQSDPGVFVGSAKSSGQKNVSLLDTKRPLGAYKLFLCASKVDAAPCQNLTVQVNSTLLTVNDLKVLDGQVTLLTLSSGANAIRYYAMDPARNVEVVKSLTVIACAACQGPVGSIVFDEARFHKGTWFTRSRSPSGRVSFDEPAELTFAGLSSPNVSVPMTTTPSSGFASSYALRSPVVAEGTYAFGLNARDGNGVLMDEALSFPFLVDVTPPTASYVPLFNQETNSSSVELVIRLSEPGVLVNVTLVEQRVVELMPEVWVLRPAPRGIASLFVTSDNVTFRANLTLQDGRKQLVVDGEDMAGNKLVPGSRTNTFFVDGDVPIIALRNPPYGFASAFVFPLTFETDSPATCRLWASPEPPLASFEDWEPFDTTAGYLHAKNNFNRVTEPDAPYAVSVWCRDGKGREKQQTFNLQVDLTAPEIITAYAHPNPIVQYPLATKLTVQTDDVSFCKYSNSSNNFWAMEGLFEGFNETGTVAHSANVTLGSARPARFYVACINLAQKGPVSASVPVTVDLSQPLMINTTSVPRAFGKKLIPIGLETNKDTVCLYTFRGSQVTFDSDVDGVPKLAHKATLAVPGSGTYAVEFSCYTGLSTTPSGIQRASANASIIVDTTAPVMVFVDDASELVEEPELTWHVDALQVNWLGRDDETGVSRYWYSIEELATRQVVVNRTPYGPVSGESPFKIRGLNLSDGRTYFFRVVPENLVGLLGNESRSDGVTVDVSKTPPQCQDLVKQENETDLDCGGVCAGCEVNRTCVKSGDCKSNYCKDGKCAPASCTDQVRNGEESDVDCGGSCSPCAEGAPCLKDGDCSTKFCDRGVCARRQACENGVVDGQESDIDCGGSCPDGCVDGKACYLLGDCAVGLTCYSGSCRVCAPGDVDCNGIPDDEDEDGVVNGDDKCAGTPRGEVVDDTGCSASQRSSCGDGITDLWRSRHFGDVRCDGDAAADADPDGDGLSNREEFEYFRDTRREIDPMSEDTDGDGWSDKREIDKGTDPTDPEDHPASVWWIWLLFVLLIAFLSYLAYLVYMKREELKRRVPVILRRPFGLPRVVPKGLPHVVPKVVPHLEDLASKVSVRDVGKDAFGKLKSLAGKELSVKEHVALETELHKSGDVFEKLRETAWSSFTLAERKDLLLKLQLYRKGKLSRAEIEALFRKLRVTAAYYKSHRAVLERELEEYGKPKSRKGKR